MDGSDGMQTVALDVIFFVQLSEDPWVGLHLCRVLTLPWGRILPQAAKDQGSALLGEEGAGALHEETINGEFLLLKCNLVL